MAQKNVKKLNEAVKPVAGSKKGPVSGQKQKELDQAEKADNQKTGSTAKSGPMKKESVDKFQQMLEYLVNEDNSRAEDLFHEIVVEKSRQIYENLLAEELEEVDESDDEEVDESDDEEVDESDDDELDESYDDEEVDESDDEEVDESDDEEVDEDFNLDEFEVEADDDMEMGGDPMDDMEMDMDDEEGDMDMDADMGGDEPVTQDDIKDLEAELADLKAEFEELMAGEEGDMDMDDEEGDMDMDDEEEDDMEMDDEEEDDMEMDDMPEENISYESKQNMSQAELMREYVNKIGGNEYQQFGKMGDNGANTKSAVASKNDMGGTAQNILRADTEAGVEANKGNLHGNPVSDQNPKDMNTGNVNVPGGKASKSMKPQSKGHGAEKKGSHESPGNKKPIIGTK